ncbi:hypothetical protein X556_1092 [Chlamydia pneumoniae B21]|nr:hypothetical protein X556_1092 [Chlamydia pneumoniae B21]
MKKKKTRITILCSRLALIPPFVMVNKKVCVDYGSSICFFLLVLSDDIAVLHRLQQ